MQNKDGHQKGPQIHPEGGHGDKTRGKIIEQLQSGPHREPRANSTKHNHDDPAAHRLVADRQQHDEAEKRSEKTRLSRDIERHRVNDSGA